MGAKTEAQRKVCVSDPTRGPGMRAGGRGQVAEVRAQKRALWAKRIMRMGGLGGMAVGGGQRNLT